MSDPIIRTVDEHVATITFDRPEVRNAFTPDMFQMLERLVRETARDRDVRCIVLQGAGESFSAGLDLVAAASRMDEIERIAREFDPHREPIVALQQIDVPVIAAINGHAAGYGVGLAINADIRVMARNARLVPPTKRGVVPESGDTYLLPRLVGWERAARFYFLGEDLPADEALAQGIVSELAEGADATRARAAELAARIAAMPPLAVRAAKRMLQAGRTDEYATHVDRVLRELMPLFRTKDFAEAMAAFFEKRPPSFTGE